MSGRTHLPSGLVTFLFTDIEGSTRLAQMLGAGYPSVLHEHRRLLRGVLTAAGGVDLFTEGDSLFVAFPDASAALTACIEAQRQLAEHTWPAPDARPRVRMGLHTGYAQPHGREYASPEVHRAARVAAAAHGGQVLCSAATAAHAAALPDAVWLLDLGLHRLRGFDDRERLYQVVAPGLERQFPRPRAATATADNLPTPVTTFIGRVEEQRTLRHLVEGYRLVTVVGAGGAGKTRLAVKVAADVVDRYPDGVWFVDLATVNDQELVGVAVAAALGLRPEPGRPVVDTIADHTAGRRVLLVLDTCDAQLTAAARLVVRLLRSSPETRVLTTSREPLAVPGEVVWRIPSLSTETPPGGGPSEAVALLLERASAARGGRPADPIELRALARVATALDGLPLALELAAARLRVLSPAQLADRTDDLLGTLDAADLDDPAEVGGELPEEPGAPSRHRTMQATVTWSYRTLGPRAARLLRWLAVFAGAVDLPAIEWLVREDPLGGLASLVDKSLVQVEPTPAGVRYRMLDAIKAYAARELIASGEQDRARDRHVDWALDQVRRAHLDGDGRPVTLSLYSLDPLAPELRAALRWVAVSGSARQGLVIVGVLDQWWRERGLAREARLWLFRLYDRMAATGEQVPDSELATAYHLHATYAGVDGEHDEELRFCRCAEEHARRAGDPGLIARVLATRGAPLADTGRVDEAEGACRQVIEYAREHGVEADALRAVYCLAVLLWKRGDLAEAADLLATARPVEAALPAERGRRTVDLLLGLVALCRGDLVGAHEHVAVALRAQITYGFHSQACEAVAAMAVRCALGGDRRTAARLFGAAQAARTRLGCLGGMVPEFWARHQGDVRRALGGAVFDEAYVDGTGLSLDEAVTLALAVEHPDLAADSVRFATVDHVGHELNRHMF